MKKRIKVHVVVEEYTTGYAILEADTEEDLQGLLEDEDAWIDDVIWDAPEGGDMHVSEIEELSDDV